MKRRQIHDVALEIIPIDLVAAELDQSLIPSELLGAGTERNRRGMDDVAEYTPAHRAPALDDVAVTTFTCGRDHLRLRQLALKLLAGLSYRSVLVRNDVP